MKNALRASRNAGRVLVEHREQRIEVTLAGRNEEGLNLSPSHGLSAPVGS